MCQMDGRMDVCQSIFADNSRIITKENHDANARILSKCVTGITYGARAAAAFRFPASLAAENIIFLN